MSILSSIWCLWCIFLFVARRTDNRAWGLVAAGLFAATFRIGGAWFDLARVDMLYLALLLSALYVTLFFRSKGSGILAGLLMALACLTKQNGLVVAAALGVYYLIYDRRAAQYISVVAAVVGVVSLMWNMASDGWFFFYLFELPSNHPIYSSRYLTFWTLDMLPHLPVALAVTAVWLLLLRSHRDRSETVFWFLITASILGSSLMGRIHSGGYDNVLIPAYAVLAITFGLGLGAISRKVGEGLTRGPRAAILYFLCLVQFGVLVYDPVANVPTDNDIRAGMSLVRDIRQRSGDVLIPFHGRLGRQAGKRSWAHEMALHDVLRGSESHWELLKGQIRAALKDRRFSAIVLDHSWHGTFLEGNYEIEDSIRVCDECFYPVTGYRVRPEVILIPSK